MPPVLTHAVQDSRLSPPTLRARLAADADGHQQVLAPAVGLYRGAPAPGSLVGPGDPIGALEILGVVHHLLAPAGAGGLVTAAGEPARVSAQARRPVAFDELLFTLDPTATQRDFAPGAAPAATAATASGAIVFRAPTSGRFYGRPGPGKPVFVSVGAILDQGQTVGLIEVMKTFSRVHYGGEGLPARARLLRICVADESDVAQGDVLFEVEAADVDPGAPGHNTEPHPS